MDKVRSLADRLLGKKKSAGGKRRARICVGVDFGTSTTKVVVAADVEGQETRRWALPLFGQSLYPSTVSVGERTVGFGTAGGGVLHRSLKMLFRQAALES